MTEEDVPRPLTANHLPNGRYRISWSDGRVQLLNETGEDVSNLWKRVKITSRHGRYRVQNAWWNRPRRMSWESRRDFLRDQGEILVDRVRDRINCLRGHHRFKMFEPGCISCGKKAR